MVSFNIEIDNKFSTDDFEGTKNTFHWIFNSLSELKVLDVPILMKWIFKTGEIACTCDTYDEFIENAYGQMDYELVSMQLYQIDLENEQNIFITATCGKIKLTANSKNKLEKLVDYLSNEKLSNNSDTYITNQYNIGDISGQDIYINQGVDNKMKIEKVSEESESKTKKWMVAILQNLLANWIWYLLGALIGGGGIYYLLNLIR